MKGQKTVSKQNKTKHDRSPQTEFEKTSKSQDSRAKRKKPFNRKMATDKRTPFIPDPKDANLVKAIREKLRVMRDYKRLIAEEGLKPDLADKELESELIKQLIRIEKGLTPKKAPKKKPKPKATERP